MPFIGTKTNVELNQEKKEIIKQKLGQAISIIPGKSENWLMVSFEYVPDMYFKGNGDKPMAFVEVKVFGKVAPSDFDKLTKEITSIISQECSIEPSQIYIKYEEVSNWGWNGSNF
ncbi:MAG: hypothetical protein K5917_08265 [Clostridiales bacterium]|nr:hypothetical protein [Clostridiales bacterium]